MIKSGAGRCGFQLGLKFYKVRTWSGSLSYTVYDACGEGGSILSTAEYAISGAATFGAGEFTECLVVSDTLMSDGELVGYGAGFAGSLQGSDANYTTSSSDTSTSYTGNGECASDGGGTLISATGSITETYSSEDTLQDAADRVDAMAWPADYGPAEYAFTVAAFGTLDPAMLTVGDGLNYQAARWQYSKNGLTPLGHYQVEIEIWRAPFLFASGVYDFSGATLYATQVETGFADALGRLVITDIAVPNDLGYMTTIKPSTLVLTAIP